MADQGLDVLLVVGVRQEVKGTAAEVERLFDSHHYSNGLELLAQGVPTNNTDGAESGWSARAADADLFERAIETPDRHRDSAKDGLYLAQALGLGKFSTLAKAVGAGRGEENAAAAMNEVLWPSVWGEYLGNMLAKRNGRAVPQSAVRFTRNWFLQNVRGGAPLPALRVGEQPYGVLPVRAAVERPEIETNQQVLEDLLRVVRELWLDAVPNVARIDPNARTEADLQVLKTDFADRFPNIDILTYAGDMGNRADVLAFAKNIKKQWSTIDVLVNNVGWFSPGEILTAEEGLLEKMMQINLFSAYQLTRAVIDLLVENKKGHIFNLCSIASLDAYPDGSLYSITKFALLGFSKSLRQELKDQAIKVTAVLPGATWTPSWAASGVNPQRLMAAQEIAQAVFNAWNMGPSAVVEEIILRPQLGDL